MAPKKDAKPAAGKGGDKKVEKKPVKAAPKPADDGKNRNQIAKELRKRKEKPYDKKKKTEKQIKSIPELPKKNPGKRRKFVVKSVFTCTTNRRGAQRPQRDPLLTTSTQFRKLRSQWLFSSYLRENGAYADEAALVKTFTYVKPKDEKKSKSKKAKYVSRRLKGTKRVNKTPENNKYAPKPTQLKKKKNPIPKHLCKPKKGGKKAKSKYIKAKDMDAKLLTKIFLSRNKSHEMNLNLKIQKGRQHFNHHLFAQRAKVPKVVIDMGKDKKQQPLAALQKDAEYVKWIEEVAFKKPIKEVSTLSQAYAVLYVRGKYLGRDIKEEVAKFAAAK